MAPAARRARHPSQPGPQARRPWRAGKLVKVFDVATGEMKHKIKKHTDWVTAIEFSPDGKLLASGDRNGGAFVWEAATGGIVFTLSDHKDCITALSWRADSQMLASASEDGTVKVWGVADGREVAHLRGHTGGVTAVAFGRDSNTLVTTSEDGTAKVWDVSRGGNPFPLNFRGWVTRVRFSPDGRRTATAHFSTVTVADAATNRSVARITPGTKIDTVAFSRDGRLVATSGARHRGGQRLGCRDRAARRRLPGPHRTAAGVAREWSPAGHGLGRRHCAARDAETGRPGPVLPGYEGGHSETFDSRGGTRHGRLQRGDPPVEVPAGRPRQLGRTTQRRSDHWPDALALARTACDFWRQTPTGRPSFGRWPPHRSPHASRPYEGTQRGGLQPRRPADATWSDDYSIKLWDAATGDGSQLRGHTARPRAGVQPDGHRILSTSADDRRADSRPFRPFPSRTLTFGPAAGRAANKQFDAKVFEKVGEMAAGGALRVER